MNTQPQSQTRPLDGLLLWGGMTLRDWRFWVFLGLTLPSAWGQDAGGALTDYAVPTYVVVWLAASLPLCLLQASLLRAAQILGGGAPLWAFLSANAVVAVGLLAVAALGSSPFPRSWFDALHWWGMLLTVACLPLSTLSRSLLLASMAWFGSTCATFSPLGVWIDIWPRPNRASMVSLFLAASWLALAACLLLRKTPHEVRHSR